MVYRGRSVGGRSPQRFGFTMPRARAMLQACAGTEMPV